MFEDRVHAGKLLVAEFTTAHKASTVVVGISRGGIVVGATLAKELQLPFFALVVKKIGAPGREELAIGAIGPESTLYFDERFIKELRLSQDVVWNLVRKKQAEVENLRKDLYEKKKRPPILKRKRILLVDDGVATGATVICAAFYLKKRRVKESILVVPVIAKDTLRSIRIYFDKVVSLRVEDRFSAVGQFYNDFHQITTQEARSYIQ